LRSKEIASDQKYNNPFSIDGGNFGLSGVRALPLAAGINVGGHNKWHFFLLLFLPGSLLILPEEIFVGFCNFAWDPM
jgi:hypothetical protein